VNRNRGQLHFALQIGDEAAEFRASGQHLREQRLAAEPPLRLEQRGLMTALGRGRRGLHAGRSAADD
jgi:hypothetical protein